MKYFHKYFPACLFLLVACQQDEGAPSDPGLRYFPLQHGDFHVYDVSETVYSEIEEPVTKIYQLKVEVTDSILNADHTTTYVLSRAERPDALAPWQDLDTWSVRIDDRKVVMNEGNTAFVKLIFPVREGVSWDGNRFNHLGEDVYEISTMHGPITVNGTLFDETLTVEQEMNGDLIVFLDERREIYAKNVGLIVREITQLHYCTEDDCRGQQQIETGRVFSQALTEYGQL